MAEPRNLDEAELASALDRGRCLYRAGRHYEAHEAWEEAWLGASGTWRDLLQGLILVAAGLHKGGVQRNPRGAATLLGRALEKLAPLPASLHGVPLDEVRAGTARARDAFAAWRDGGPPAAPEPPTV